MSDLEVIPEDSSEDRILPTIEQILQCQMCLDRFQDPKLLPCGHTFCQVCLECRSRTTHVMCPLDNKKHPLPEKGVAGFPTNVTADSLANVVFSSSSTGDSVLKYCCSDCGDFCTELKRCFNHCSAMLCEQCLDDHIEGIAKDIQKVLFTMRKRLDALKDMCEKWETQHRVLYSSYEEARSEFDNVFKLCLEKLRQKHLDRQNDLDDMVRPHLDAFENKICKIKDCRIKAEEVCEAIENRLRNPDDVSEVDLLCTRLKCLQQMAILEDFATKDAKEEPCGKIETVKIEMEEDWMNYCIGKLFRKSIVCRLGT